MKVTTKIVWDMSTMDVLEHQWFEYSGTLDLCKGEGHAQDQLNQQNQLVQQQVAQQKAIRDQIMGSVGKYLTGAGEGFDPQQLAIMQSQFLDQNAAAGKQAGQNVMGQLAARGAAGGALPVGGDFARSLEGLQGQIATSQSQGILGTNLANLQQALNNRFNAASVASGQSAQIGSNIGTFNSGANNALNQYMQAANSGFGANFMRSLGSGLGSGVASSVSAGLGSAESGIAKSLGGLGGGGSSNGMGPGDIGFCWIAETLYGPEDIRTHATRLYLTSDFSRTPVGKVVVSSYKRFGQRVASTIARKPFLKAIVRPFFDYFASKGMDVFKSRLKAPTGQRDRFEDFEGIEYQR